MAGTGAVAAQDTGGIWYDVPVLLPLIVGTMVALGGIGLLLGASHEDPGRELLLGGAVALLLTAVVSYLVIGLWLVPVSLGISGLFWIGQFELLAHLPGGAGPAGGACLLIGGLGVAVGLARRRVVGARTD